MIPNPWVILGAVAFLLLSVSGAYFAGRWEGISDTEAAYTKQDLKAAEETITGLQSAALAMNGLAGQFTAISQDLSTEINSISGKFRNGARANPLPASCVPDPFRVQSLSEAITATNNAIGRGAVAAVPAP